MARPVCHGRPGEEHVSSEMTETDSDGLWRCPECDSFVEASAFDVDAILDMDHVEAIRVSDDTVHLETGLDGGSDLALDVLARAKRLAGDREPVLMG